MAKRLLANREEFLATFPVLIKDFLNTPEFADIPKTTAWAAKVLEYNVANTDLNQGMAFLLHYEHLASDLTEEDIQLSYILGWCVEFLQSFLHLSEDIVAGAETRRGRPCWHRVEGVGLSACNDALIIEYCMYYLLEKYFKDESYYLDLVELFHDTTFTVTYGRGLDARVKLQKNASLFTEETFATIAKRKTSFFSLPLASAMTMAGVNYPEVMIEAQDVLKEIGVYHQAQYDFFGLYGDSEITAKKCTNDVADGKCSWVVVTALKLANTAERQLIMENYGKSDVEKVRTCKELFMQVGVPEFQSEYQRETYRRIKCQINKLPSIVSKKLMHETLENVRRRSEVCTDFNGHAKDK